MQKLLGTLLPPMSNAVSMRVLKTQLNQLCSYLLAALLIQPVGALLLAVIAGLPVVFSLTINGWLGLHLLLPFFHYWLCRNWHQSEQTNSALQYAVHVGMAACHGLLWGSSIWLLPDSNQHNSMMLILMCLVTVSSANMFVYSAFRMTALSSALSLWLPVIVWLAVYDYFYWIAGIAGFVFLQAIFNLQAYRIMVAELIASDQKDELMLQLDLTNQALNRSNASLAEKNRDLRDALAKIESLANFDSLTGAPNRKSFVKHMSQHLENGETGYIALMDIKALQTINENHGQHTGDEVLQNLGSAIAKGSCDSDLYARLNGGTFILFLNSDRLLSMQTRFDELTSAMKNLSTQLGLPEVYVAAGMTVVSQYEPLDMILARAEEALRKAKRHAENRIALA
ncbi:MAG: GGDEF domain-containing protein [Vogesella sp.]|uniref:GGDEF domain-containing protein n=1 Tax=Vogesella sp. TaxID=1904252 RepID=UPI00391DE5AF